MITIKTNITRSQYDHKLIIPATAQTIEQVIDLQAKSKNGLEVIIKPFVKKKSLDANARCWATCNEIAKKLTAEGAPTTDKDIYRKTILESTAFWIRPVKNEQLEAHKNKFERIGIGWQVVEHSPCKTDGWTNVYEYYGSRIYTTEEISNLINNLNQECEALDIPIMPSREVRALLDEWNRKEK
jgi:hypothetical protein